MYMGNRTVKSSATEKIIKKSNKKFKSMITYFLSIIGDLKVEESHLYDHTELHL